MKSITVEPYLTLNNEVTACQYPKESSTGGTEGPEDQNNRARRLSVTTLVAVYHLIFLLVEGSNKELRIVLGLHERRWVLISA